VRQRKAPIAHVSRESEQQSYDRVPYKNEERILAVETSTSNKRDHGIVKWFDKVRGYGFINLDGNSEGLFVHFTSIVSADKQGTLVPARGYRQLAEGQEVEFEIEQCPRGFQAVRVLPRTALATAK
jgi:CspA family cold shock protein